MPATLELSDQHMAVIAEALGNMPLRVALPVVNEINRQLAEQQKRESPEIHVPHQNGGAAADKGATP